MRSRKSAPENNLPSRPAGHLIRARALTCPDLGRMNGMRLLLPEWNRRGAAARFGCARRQWPSRDARALSVDQPPSDDIGRRREAPMNSTPTPKATDTLVGRADEQLAHAREQFARADEQLARLSEQVAKMERDATRPPSAGSGPQSPPKTSAFRAVVVLPTGGMHHCRCSGFAVVLWRRGKTGCRPWGARARFSPIIAAGKSAASRATHSIYRPGGRCGGSTAARKRRPVVQTAPQGAAPTATQRFPIKHIAANDGARSREYGAKHRTTQGQRATNSARQIPKPLRSSRRARKR